MINILSYKIVKLEKFPNSVGIVPDNWLLYKYLFSWYFAFFDRI